MPDITMCLTVKCPKKKTCYRASAAPNPYWQSMANFEGTCNKETDYPDYIKMEESKSNKKKETK